MNKSLLIKQILQELENVHQVAAAAAQRAYDTATDEENEAENKYDTLGLEASYLAHGQSKRVAECEADLITFSKLKIVEYLPDSSIVIGTLVSIEDEEGTEQFVFLSPVAGGLKFRFNHKEITIVTPSAPLGKALISSRVDDDIEVQMGLDKKYYQITAAY
ncbi:MAG: transcription elongation factor [endosymbiont of Galathealinum brachiosum]|uniref:Transcription elongation factor n=1 Tax=endosymbiont of Galathealinum brachiosum TaxID=2200906 RepID=A0A370DNX6_9GAMM|nr:MAG: transcription elongation factor [endosymbiont of Galathealinum brachiosum]